MKYILIGLALFSCVFLSNAQTTTYIDIPPQPVEVVVVVTPPVRAKTALQGGHTDIDALITIYAKKWAVSETILHKVIFCESGYNRYAIGDNGHSRGLVQIYDNYHPTITHEQAYDPNFAINFLAENISNGKGRMWTCYRNIQ